MGWKTDLYEESRYRHTPKPDNVPLHRNATDKRPCERCGRRVWAGKGESVGCQDCRTADPRFFVAIETGVRCA